jgi:hypothetical protein
MSLYMSIRACWADTARARQSTARVWACRARPDSILCRAVLARGLKAWPKHDMKEAETGRAVPVAGQPIGPGWPEARFT